MVESGESPSNGALVCATLPSRALIRVAGPDWRSFLQGLITQDVTSLAPGEMRFGAMLTPQGKFAFDLFLTGEDDGCLLDVQAARRDALVQRLTLYRLRAKVDVAAVDGPVWVAWKALLPRGEKGWDEGEGSVLTSEHDKAPAPVNASPPVTGANTLIPGPSPLEGEGRLFDPRLSALGWRVVGDAPANATVADEDAYDAHRLALGVPDPARDCIADKTYPIEANFDLLNGIDFKKGCFVGQETTSRMKRRGQIKSRMLPIVFDGPPPAFGAEVLAGDLRAGEVLSGRDGRALALLRLDRIEAASLTVDGRPVRPERPSWMDLA